MVCCVLQWLLVWPELMSAVCKCVTVCHCCREPFILSNLHFYTNLLGEFLNRAPQLNLKQKNDVDVLARVAKVQRYEWCW